MFLYADDISLIAPSVCMLEKLLKICERELDLLDMVINVKKSCCVKIGPRNSFSCSPISTVSKVQRYGASMGERNKVFGYLPVYKAILQIY